MNIWQIAAGDGNREYSEVFLRYGVILIGPGSYGDYFENQDIYDDNSHHAYSRYYQSFMKDMQTGDLVILKSPHGNKWEIVAVGKVRSDYFHTEVFEDVEGWPLQHCRKVQWKRSADPTIISGLRRGTLFGVDNQIPRKKAQKIWKTGVAIQSERIPELAEDLEDEQLIDLLMISGLSGNDADIITRTIWRIRRLAKWYDSQGRDVGEHEIRTFLIVPLLIALGFPEQRIKIEWNNIDISIFESPFPSEQENPVIILETKRLHDGLRYAPDQAKYYLQDYPNCCFFIVSNGIHYKLFERIEGEWQFRAYANLLSLKSKHPYFREVKGAAELFLKILPLL